MKWFLALILSIATVSANTNAIIVFAGHSIVLGVGASPQSASNFVSQLKTNLLSQFGTYMTNAGVSGAKIRDNTNHTTFAADLNAKNNYLKRTILCMYGDNDLSDNTSVAETTNAFRNWVINARASWPDAMLVGMTGQVIDWGVSSSFSNRWVGLQDFIRNTNQSGFDSIIDVHGNPKFQNPFDTTYYDGDKTHLNNTGYRELALMVMTNLLNNRRLAIDWRVRKDGSDSNKGTTNSAAGAFLTLDKAEDISALDDRVYVGDGVFPEYLTLSEPGVGWYGSGTNSCTNGGFAVSATNITLSGFSFNGTNYTESGAIFVNPGGHGLRVTNVAFAPLVNGAVAFIYGSATPSSATNCWFERLYSINSSNFIVGALGEGWRFTNFVFLNSNGWDAFRVHCDNAIISGGTITLANPAGNENHPDFFQSFPSSPNNARGVIVENVMCIGAGTDDVQMGNFSDDAKAASTANWTFRNNVFVDVPRTINLVAPGFSFYHNTFVRSATGSGSCITITSNNVGVASNTTILNNIFVDSGTTNNNSHGWYGGDNCNRVIADYNLVTPGKTQSNWTNGVGGIVGPFETHGLNGYNPLFVSSSSDFRLQSGSPALNAGTNLLSLVATDILGASRDSTPSLGAYEADGGGGSSAIQARTGTGRPTKPR